MQVVKHRTPLQEDCANANATPGRKILWCSLNQKDNYIDDFFLESLVVNASLRERSYWRVVSAALAVDQQLSIVAIVSTNAYLLHSEALSTRILLFLEAVVMLGAILLQTLALFSARDQFYKYIRRTGTSVAIMVLLIAALTPLYGTLAGSISSDSVITLAVLLLLGHLYLYEYEHRLRGVNTVNGSISLACALCSSVLLASQLKNLEDVFALMILSTEAYIILPPIISQIAETTSPWGPMITSLAICTTAVLLVTKVSVVITSALLCSLACITFICPMWLVRIQKYKAQINGPWDEAIPKLSVALMKKT